MKYTNLFSPIKIGEVEIKNRFYQPSMGISDATFDGQPGEGTIDYYRTRAEGGFGICTVDYCYISPEGKAIPFQMGIENDARIEPLSKVAEAIHSAGAVASIQICHAGRSTMSLITQQKTYAPSRIPCQMYKSMPEELTREQIFELIDKFGAAALRAKKAGFDMVELHCGHTYLIDQFIDAWCNKRIDEFGGCLENRTRFARLIIAKIKELCGCSFPIICKITSDNGEPDGTKINDACAVAMQLENAGADCIAVSIGGYGRFDLINAPYTQPAGFFLNNAEAVKKCVSIPVIGFGRINDPTLAEMAIHSGKCDLIALGRQSLADPEFPNKVAAGAEEDIFHCMGCNIACVNENAEEGTMGSGCMLNPFAGREYRMTLNRAENSKKIVIVGGGPAGLECAWVAAKRGHKVVLLEKQDKVGGQYRIASMPPFKQGSASAIHTMLRMCEKYGVDLRYGIDAREDDVMAENPDVVVLATGGTPLIPNIPGIDSEGVLNAIDVIQGFAQPGNSCIILGGGLVGVETCDMMSAQNKKVAIVEMTDQLGKGEHFAIQQGQYERFKQRDVDIHVNTTVTKITSNSVECKDSEGNYIKLEADNIILALGAQSNDPLAGLEGKVPELYKIGDCKKARKALNAIFEGAKLGSEL